MMQAWSKTEGLPGRAFFASLKSKPSLVDSGHRYVIRRKDSTFLVLILFDWEASYM
jgi:hypothetical protein